MAWRVLLSAVLAVDLVHAQGLGGLWPVPQPTFSHGTTPLFINENAAVTFNGASVRWSTHAHPHTFDDLNTEHPSQKQLTYTSGYEATSLATADIIQSALSRTFDNIFSHNFVPWMLVPRRQLAAHEPSLNGSVASLTSLDIILTSNVTTFQPVATGLDESYNLTITEDGAAKLEAYSTNGVLHGLETFSQLFYQHSTDTSWYLVNAPIQIQDEPTYPWRGLMLDTARHWFHVEDIKRTIDGLSYSKLNKLHIHVTDSQSWPLEVPSIPELTEKGAYSQSAVYSPDDIKTIQEYGIHRGIDVYFEIDMPGHIGVVGEAFPDLVVAYDAQPYTSYCAQPPCGAFRLNSSDVDEFLGTLFADVLPRVAPYTAYWHTGGDELNANDSALDPGLQTNDTTVLQPLLQEFIDTQHDRVRAFGLSPLVWEEIPTTWNVTLGPDVVVQSWLGGTAVPDLAESGHKVIDSNYNFWVRELCGVQSVERRC